MQETELNNLSQDRDRLLGEMVQLRASQPSGVTLHSPTAAAHLSAAHAGAAVGAPGGVSPAEAALRSVGSLKAYEVVVAVFFVFFMFNWFFSF